MAKLKKQLIKEVSQWKLRFAGAGMMLLVVSLLALVGGVAAKQGAFDWMAVQKDVADQIADSVIVPQPEQNLGAMASPYRYNQVECDNDWCTATVTVDNNSASTTIFSVSPPFRAATTTGDEVVVEDGGRVGWTVPTSSLDLVAINVKTAATTTYSVFCGTASTAYATSTGALTILETGTTVTSTPYLENNISAANADGGYLTGTVDKVFVTPQRPYVICKVNPSASDAFASNPTFDATASFRFRRLQR